MLRKEDLSSDDDTSVMVLGCHQAFEEDLGSGACLLPYVGFALMILADTIAVGFHSLLFVLRARKYARRRFSRSSQRGSLKNDHGDRDNFGQQLLVVSG